ncbi:MAG: LPS export ABC transporter periplasmic protein LptC [Alphaproteobacteria bacterium]|nr:LPS export ABC transporter periplasmic protein LptC [Alphaproteobacteria bacterium]
MSALLVRKILKYGLPGLGLVAAALLLWLPQRELAATQLRLSETRVVTNQPMSMAMQQAVFQGQDQENRHFRLQTDITSTMNGGLDDTPLRLQKPSGDISLSANRQLLFSSDTGMFQPKEKILTLTDNVLLKLDTQTELRAHAVHIDLSKSQLSTSSNVSGSGTFGQVLAEGFVFDEQQKIIFLNGKTTIQLSN